VAYAITTLFTIWQLRKMDRWYFFGLTLLPAVEQKLSSWMKLICGDPDIILVRFTFSH